MSNFEIFLIVMFCAMPIVALLMILPKKVKKSKEKKSEPEPVKSYQEIKQEEKKEEVVENVEPKKENIKFSNSEISKDEFKSYLELKKNNITKPRRVELPNDFKDMTLPYSSRRRVKEDKKPQSVAEEIKNLSPELKTMLIAGVLDRKNFDN